MDYVVGVALGWLAFAVVYLIAIAADLYTWIRTPEKLSREKTDRLRDVLNDL